MQVVRIGTITLRSALRSVALCAALLFAFSNWAVAETIRLQGVGSVPYGFMVSSANKQEALAKAKINAIDRYIAETNLAKSRNYESVRKSIIGDLDSFILGTQVTAGDADSKLKMYTVSVTLDVNGPRLKDAIQKGFPTNANTTSPTSTSPRADGPSSSEKSLLTFVFVARQQKSVKSFDDRVHKRGDTEESVGAGADINRKTSEAERVGKTKVQTADKDSASIDVKRTTSTSTTTGGYKLRTSEEVEWNVTRASEINTVMSGIFAEAGYEVVDAEYVEQESKGLMSVDAVRKDYQTGDDITPATLRGVTNGVKTAGIPYVAYGTLDVEARDLDPVSGLMRITVSVTGKILNVSGRFPRTVSSVGPVQVQGLGKTETSARIEALKIAAEKVAQQMVEEAAVKNVQ